MAFTLTGADRGATVITAETLDTIAAVPVEHERASILVVDDRTDKRLALASVLDELRQEVVTAASGEDALRKVLEHDFAVILLDVNMPGLDGLETAALIRRRKKSAHTPIIFVTADYNDEQHQAKGYALGAVDYIDSPVVPEILCAKVKVFVDLFLFARQAKRRSEERIALAEEKAARVAAEQATQRLTFLAQASTALGGSLDAMQITQELARLVVPTLADFIFITLLSSDDGRPRHEVGLQRAGDVVLERVEGCEDAVADAAIQRVLRGAEGEWWSQGGDRGRRLSSSLELAPGISGTSLIVVPLHARGRTLGALALGLGPSGRTFDVDTTSVARDLASRAGLALDNAALYQKIHDADQRKNEFIAMLAHELRNPLAPIRNALHLLQYADSDPTRAAWARDIIHRQLRQLVRLVDDLLDLSRITRGKIELKIEAVDVAEVVAAAVETAKPAVDALGHTLTLTLPSEPLRIKGDLLGNIVNNAAKYTERSGKIVLSATREGGEVVVRVRDTGVGIQKEYLKTIFEPFTQLARTIDRAQGGLGIGLTLVQRLVEMQGGSVSALSEGRDRGSEFVVRLPASSESPPANPSNDSRQSVAPFDSRPMSVLVVDDNVDVAESTAIVLRVTGCVVHLAHDGTSALESVTRLSPDVVLLDIGLPGMDGYQVAEQIRARPEHKHTLLLAVSGYGQEEHRARSKKAGFDDHLVKPIDPIALMELMRSQRSGGDASPASH